jgi:hypothetical protein
MTIPQGGATYAGGALSDRRRYPRIQADVLCRPAGSPLLHHRRNTQDISLGGVRVFSDESFAVGTRLDLEVLTPIGGPVRCWAEVVWIVDLGTDGPARFDIGLKFTDMSPADIQALAAAMVPVG